MRRLVAAVAVSGALIGGGVGVPLVLTAQPAAAASHDLSAAMRLCENGYRGSFVNPNPLLYGCTVPVFDHHVDFTAAENQCKGVYDGSFLRVNNENFLCAVGGA
jgi:hypothetical protein